MKNKEVYLVCAFARFNHGLTRIKRHGLNGFR